MDTILLPTTNIKKSAIGITGIGLAVCLLISQNFIIPTKGFALSTYTGLTPALNSATEELQKEELFNQDIKNKYIGCQITDIEKGIKHIKMLKFYNNRPVRINIIELSTDVNKDIQVEPQIASSNNNLSTRTKISAISQRTNAIAAINGGYFKPQTGVPLGTLMINKQFYTGPIYDRVAMGITDTGYEMARVQLKANIKTNKGSYKIDNINQPRMLSTHVIAYTPSWGAMSPMVPKYGKALVIDDNKLVNSAYGPQEIPKNGYVIVGPAKKLDEFEQAKKFELDLKTNPEWENLNHIVSGGPYLIKNNEIYVDMTAQKLASVGGRNPRTAIGYTKDNHLIMLTADGREGSSIGLTLIELAYLMKELGCVNAMNLDGGGSTVMYLQGKVVNKPQVSGGIPLSNTIAVVHKNYS